MTTECRPEGYKPGVTRISGGAGSRQEIWQLPTLVTLHSLGKSQPWLDPPLHLQFAPTSEQLSLGYRTTCHCADGFSDTHAQNLRVLGGTDGAPSCFQHATLSRPFTLSLRWLVPNSNLAWPRSQLTLLHISLRKLIRRATTYHSQDSNTCVLTSFILAQILPPYPHG